MVQRVGPQEPTMRQLRFLCRARQTLQAGNSSAIKSVGSPATSVSSPKCLASKKVAWLEPERDVEIGVEVFLELVDDLEVQPVRRGKGAEKIPAARHIVQ